MVDRLEEFLARANRFVSPRTGLIRRVFQLNTETDDARIHYVATDVVDTSRYGFRVRCFDHNGGAGLTYETALAAALGETLERYSCSVYFPDQLVLASYEQLEGRAVHPDLLTPYSTQQYGQPGFPFQPFTVSSPVRWIQGTSLVTGEPIWYPAGLTYVPYVYEGETPIGPSVSTGMALGLTPYDAILSGLCEVVERDAVMIMWWNALSMPEIEVPEGTWLARVIRERFTVPGVTFRLFDITTDVAIPTVFCVALEERENGCAVACGAATRPDPAQAALKALIEAAQTRAWVRSMTRQYGPPDPGPGFARVTSFEDHVRLYGQPSMRSAIEFLTDSGLTKPLSEMPSLEVVDIETTIRNCVQAVAAKGLEPIVLDVTPEDVAMHQLWAMKVAIPGMVELNADHHLRFLGSRRLFEVPVRLRLRTERPSEADLNPNPHPFP